MDASLCIGSDLCSESSCESSHWDGSSEHLQHGILCSDMTKNSADHWYILVHWSEHVHCALSRFVSWGRFLWVVTTCDFCRNWGKLALKLIFFLEHWFIHVLWWLLGIVKLRRSLWVPSSCDFYRQIIRVSTGNGYFALHWIRHVLLERHREGIIGITVIKFSLVDGECHDKEVIAWTIEEPLKN